MRQSFLGLGQRPFAGLLIAVVCVFGTVPSCLLGQDAAEPSLTIGSPAPALDVEHWVQTAGDKFKPVTTFEKGNVYVVEFWATWCGPCIASMPHINQLQNDYQAKGVQVVSISDEDLETVTGFLKKPAQRAKKPAVSEENEKKDAEKDEPELTYADVTKDYCLTTDPDGSCEKDYMRAAGQNGIPTAFLVGKSGRIEWIGHPMTIDEPLKAVVEDKWDREAFAKEFKAQQEEQLLMREISMKMRAKDVEGAIKILDEAMEKGDESTSARLLPLKLRVLMSTGDEEAAVPVAKEVFKRAGDRATEVNNYAWMIFQFASRDKSKESALVPVALAAAESASSKATGTSKAFLYDTLAHLYHLSGDKTKAIEAQRIAAASEGADQTPEIAAFLKELESEATK